MTNIGSVVAVRGSVVDIRFDAHLPPIYSLLHAQERMPTPFSAVIVFGQNPTADRWR